MEPWLHDLGGCEVASCDELVVGVSPLLEKSAELVGDPAWIGAQRRHVKRSEINYAQVDSRGEFRETLVDGRSVCGWRHDRWARIWVVQRKAFRINRICHDSKRQISESARIDNLVRHLTNDVLLQRLERDIEDRRETKFKKLCSIVHASLSVRVHVALVEQTNSDRHCCDANTAVH